MSSTYASTDIYYESGFTNGNSAPSEPDHLPGHTTFDVTIGKNFGERLAVGVSGMNIANRRVLRDNSFTFGGTHYMNPREIFV
jgi:outer membrane receptor protein involved in Fe transport